VEFIDESGLKSALAGGTKKGGYWVVGEPTHRTFLCEGVATAVSINSATGCRAVAALSCSNLQEVIISLQGEIIVMADLGNGGKDAYNAAKANGALCLSPSFTEIGAREFQLDWGKPPDDFNDMMLVNGRDGLSNFINQAIGGVTVKKTAPTKPENISKFPLIDARPCYYVIKEDTGTHKAGVYFCDKVKETHISTPVCIGAIVVAYQGHNAGINLEIQNRVGGWSAWLMPAHLAAQQGGVDIKAELLRRGAVFNPRPADNRLDIVTYILEHQKNIGTIKTSHSTTGWQDGHYILPNKIIGASADDKLFLGAGMESPFKTRGDLNDWRTNIAKKVKGNPILALSLGQGFAGPLISLTGSEPGGFHIIGDSSSGKTTALKMAASIWGGRSFLNTWRATSNGLEGIATLFNDGLLILDEISQAAPDEVGNIIYMLGNGVGKTRATRSGAGRPSSEFRTAVLSSGERSVSSSINESKRAGAITHAGAYLIIYMNQQLPKSLLIR
jgi:putative DNA primase/helicase